MPLSGGSLVVGRHVADALRDLPDLTCAVQHTQPLYTLYEKSFSHLSDPAERRRLLVSHLDLAVLGKVVEFKPDVLLVMALAPVSPWLIEQVKQLGVITAHWYIENFRYYPAHELVPPWQVIAPSYDYFFTIQKDGFFDLLRSRGVKRFYYLPCGCNPRLHHPIRDQAGWDPAFFSDLCFVGSPYPNRRTLFQALVDLQPALWGPGWSEDPLLKPFARGHDLWVSSRDECKILNGAKIALNIHSHLEANHGHAATDFLNPRVFTIAACCAFQLVDEQELLAEAFVAGSEVAVYQDASSLKKQVRYYLDHPAERDQMARRAYARVLADHTYAKRMESILKIMNLR